MQKLGAIARNDRI